jgi:hypothetical protein
MLKLAAATIGLITLTAAPTPRSRAAFTTLKVESMAARPVTFTVWMGAPRRSERLDGDSVTQMTPASIPIDSATREIRILTRANAPVRVRVLADSIELERPANAWGRDVRLRRVDDHFEVVSDMKLIQPR